MIHNLKPQKTNNKMRLLTALVAFLSVASAITNGKQSESMKVNSTGGSILLAAKVAAFGEFMKAAADPKGMDTYAVRFPQETMGDGFVCPNFRRAGSVR